MLHLEFQRVRGERRVPRDFRNGSIKETNACGVSTTNRIGTAWVECRIGGQEVEAAYFVREGGTKIRGECAAPCPHTSRDGTDKY